MLSGFGSSFSYNDIIRMLNLPEPSQISKYEMSWQKYASPMLAYLYKNIQLIPHRFSPKRQWISLEKGKESLSSSLSCFRAFYRDFGKTTYYRGVRANRDIKTNARFVENAVLMKEAVIINQSKSFTNKWKLRVTSWNWKRLYNKMKRVQYPENKTLLHFNVYLLFSEKHYWSFVFT